VAFSLNGEFAPSGSQAGDFMLRDVRAGELVQVLANHNGTVQALEGKSDGQVTSMAWLQDGERIASGFSDGTIKLWERLPGPRWAGHIDGVVTGWRKNCIRFLR